MHRNLPPRINTEFTDVHHVPTLVCQWLAQRLTALQHEAQLLVDDYWARLKLGREGRRRSERGSLGVRLRPRDTGGFSIEWYELGSLGTTGRSIARKQVPKGRGWRYPLTAALKGEPDWIVQLVQESEDMFAELRKQQALLVAIRDRLVAYEADLSGTPVTAADLIARGSVERDGGD